MSPAQHSRCNSACTRCLRPSPPPPGGSRASASPRAPPMYRPSSKTQFATSAQRNAWRMFEGSRYFVALKGGSALKWRWISNNVCQSLWQSSAGASAPQSAARSRFSSAPFPARRAAAMPASTCSKRGACAGKDNPSRMRMSSSSRRSSWSIAWPFSNFDSSFHLFSVQPKRSKISNSSFNSLKKRLLLISASAFLLHADFRFLGSSDGLWRPATKRPVLAPHVHSPRNWLSPCATEPSLW
mmetsp:Transcript_104955/g.321532  ORF Transcript_104955/g.321532 Transcript_104955/m.321532 type:complete len:241 (+) Transcript_104955:1069-1791(+)